MRLHSKAFLLSLLLLAGILIMSTDPSLSLAQRNTLPKGWVYLSDIDPTIDLDMRYATTNNFTGRVVKGYHAPECIMRRGAANALKRVQHHIAPLGLSLKIYDCYRPVRAVKDFGRWARQPSPPEEKQRYFPRLAKSQLYGKGYIAKRSNHSRGNTVDLSLMPLNANEQEVSKGTGMSCLLPKEARISDNSLEMGTAFDCFDVLTHTRHRGITGEARKNRMLLQRVMKRYGFKNYHMEWWHFTYHKTATPRVYYDFPIVAKPE